MSLKVIVLSVFVLLLTTGSILGGILVVNSIREGVDNNYLGSATEAPNPTLSPDSVPIAVTATPKSVVVDPIVDCGTEWQRKNNKMARVKKSLCDSYVDCRLDETRIIRASKQSCDTALAKIQGVRTQLEQEKQGQASIVSCQLKSGWIEMKVEDCIKAQEEWRNQIEEEVIKEQIKQENEAIQGILNQ